FTPNLLNDFRIGFSYFPVTEGFSNPTGQNLPQAFGIAGVTDTFLPALVFSGSGLQPGAIGNNDLVQSFHDTTLQFEDTFTLTRGKHVLHAGFEVYRYIQNDLYPGNAGLAGQFTFNGQFTGNNGSSPGFSAADFLLGLPQDVQQGNGGGGNRYLRNSLIAGFGQDNWRITNNLTLNLGLRYELTTPRYEANDRAVNFNIFTGQPQIAGTNGASRATYESYTGIGNFQPRIGIAWSPDFLRNTVFRGAYGISSFMEANGVNNLPYQNPPFIQAHEVSFISSTALPSSTLDQGFSNFPAAGCTVAALQALSPLCIQGATLHLTNTSLRPAVDQQWNFSIQHQFGSHTSFQVGYVGNKIDHMSNIFIFNQKVLNPNGTVSPGPFAQPLINCCGAGNSPTIRFNDSSAIQRYNALQTTFEQRAFHGLDFKANYTWSKCLNNSLGYFGPFGDEEALPGTTSQTGFNFFYQNSYNPKGDYGLCIADAKHLFNGYLVYELPFGHGKLFGGSASDVVNAIIGGWTVATNFTLHSGFAITPLGSDSSSTGSASPRANCPLGVSKDGSGAIVNLSPVGTPPLFGKQWWNPVSATPGTPGHFGNCGIGSFRGPGLTTADLNVAKRFALTERMNVELLAQFINVTNTPILGRPSFFQGSTFGTITSSNPGRQVQFGLKLHY
ncbi:MAG TPA: TonB-dependent receptor, partial [Terriglobales bacterium]|nr:TonB-dependent receptor [Terriglobales bacterium]